ncbi:MAG: glycosyltransferase [Prevotella sp.]|nr:glycosyltransferase [Prevotella sp.]
MIHIALIDESYPINTRNTKILNSLATHYGKEAKLSVITWDRSNRYTDDIQDYHVYKRDSAYGNKTRKLMNLWGYRRFCHEQIRKLNPDVVIASHWNNLLSVPRLDRRRQMFIYENLDVPTEAYLLRKASSLLEHWHLHRVDLIIHASRFFQQLYSQKIPQIVLENKPAMATEPQGHTLHHPIRVAYIGALRYIDMLKHLVDAVRGEDRIQLFFHGGGHAEDGLKAYAGNEPNIIFTGYYKYEQITELYRQADVVWAAYPNKDFNVKYAISNKFHESLAFAVPAIYSEQTCLGDFVEQNGIGITINPNSADDIRRRLQELCDGKYDMAKIQRRLLEFQQEQTTWESDFRQVVNAVDHFLHS